MESSIIKNYYSKIEQCINDVNDNDSFSTKFIKAISSGDNTIFQKYIAETKVIDDNWINIIEGYLYHLDTILRTPRSFIKSERNIVPVERAKKITSETIRHLASHSQYVQAVTNGEVHPKKLLTEQREEDFGIYENRFIKSLYDKLTIFIEKRYTIIKKLLGTDFLNKFQNSSKFDFNDLNIEYELKLNVFKKIENDDNEVACQKLFKRVEILRDKIRSFLKSPLMVQLKNVKPITPPIQKTNILNKDPNYRKCYELWLYLDSVNALDYKVETNVIDKKFNENYLTKIQEIALLNFATVVGNDEILLNDFQSLPEIEPQEGKLKILSNNENLANKNMQLETSLINEFYYQESRKLYSRRINERVENGDPFHVALKDIYIEAFKITDLIFNSLMEVPEDIKEDPIALLRFRMRNHKAIEEVYQFKLEDLRKMAEKQNQLKQEIERDKQQIELEKLKTNNQIPKAKELREKQMEKLQEIQKQQQERIKRETELEKEKVKLKIQQELKKAELEAQEQLKMFEEILQREIDRELERFEDVQAQAIAKANAELEREKAKIWEAAEKEIAERTAFIKNKTVKEIEQINKRFGFFDAVSTDKILEIIELSEDGSYEDENN